MRATALPCKPYPKQRQLGQCGCPPGPERRLEPRGDAQPRKIVVHDRTRLTGSLSMRLQIQTALCWAVFLHVRAHMLLSEARPKTGSTAFRRLTCRRLKSRPERRYQ